MTVNCQAAGSRLEEWLGSRAFPLSSPPVAPASGLFGVVIALPPGWEARFGCGFPLRLHGYRQQTTRQLLFRFLWASAVSCHLRNKHGEFTIYCLGAARGVPLACPLSGRGFRPGTLLCVLTLWSSWCGLSWGFCVFVGFGVSDAGAAGKNCPNLDGALRVIGGIWNHLRATSA